ncbi:hypothetical protein LP420_39780 [Massilia sp. B-10]|nr:hypothetical protein LP420_39780 [Massilia sp. B-10]
MTMAGKSVHCSRTGTRRPRVWKLVPRCTWLGFSPSGSRLEFASWRAAFDNTSACFGTGPDQYLFGTLLNMTADLRVLRSATAGGLQLRGSAADANFQQFTLEYALKDAPGVWKTIMLKASSQPVADKVFTTWAPPAYGNYLVRLTVEDLVSNRRQQIRQVSWTDSPSITDLYKDVDFVSPNGDSNADALSLHYRVVEPVHLEFTVYDDSACRADRDRRPLQRRRTCIQMGWPRRPRSYRARRQVPYRGARFRVLCRDRQPSADADHGAERPVHV